MTDTRDEIPDLQTLLGEVRRRPAMWLGCKSIGRLRVMLAGIQFAEEFHDVRKEARFGGVDFVGFEKWVERAYNPQQLTLDSFGLSRYLAGSEEDGFDVWFSWYDEFLALP